MVARYQELKWIHFLRGALLNFPNLATMHTLSLHHGKSADELKTLENVQSL